MHIYNNDSIQGGKNKKYESVNKINNNTEKYLSPVLCRLLSAGAGTEHRRMALFRSSGPARVGCTPRASVVSYALSAAVLPC